MEYKFVIQGRLDGLNEYTAANRTSPRKGGKMKAQNQEVVQWAIRQQLRRLHISRPVRIIYDWFEKDRKRDLDNISSFGRKVIQDALVKCGTLQGDGWKHIVGFTDNFHCDPGNPRIEIIIREVEI